MGQALAPKYAHGEAFCIMTYQSKDGRTQKIFWNSRDGVTPFIVFLDDVELQHIEWGRDYADPMHWTKLKPGDRIFVDLTLEAATEQRVHYVDKHWDHPEYPMRGRFNSKEEAVEILAGADMERPGEPDVVQLTAEHIEAWKKAEAFSWPVEV